MISFISSGQTLLGCLASWNLTVKGFQLGLRFGVLPFQHDFLGLVGMLRSPCWWKVSDGLWELHSLGTVHAMSLTWGASMSICGSPVWQGEGRGKYLWGKDIDSHTLTFEHLTPKKLSVHLRPLAGVGTSASPPGRGGSCWRGSAQNWSFGWGPFAFTFQEAEYWCFPYGSFFPGASFS